MRLSKYVEMAGRTSGTVNSRESKNASNAIRREIKKAFPDGMIKHNTGHFYASGFVRVGDVVVYYSTGDFRGSFGPYIRYARDEKDYTGEQNNTVNYDNIADRIRVLINQRKALAG